MFRVFGLLEVLCLLTSSYYLESMYFTPNVTSETGKVRVASAPGDKVK